MQLDVEFGTILCGDWDTVDMLQWGGSDEGTTPGSLESLAEELAEELASVV